MREYRVKLSSFDDVHHFVAITTCYPFSIHVVAEDKLTNAKSMIGYFTMDLTQPVTIRVEDDTADVAPLLQQIAQYLV